MNITDWADALRDPAKVAQLREAFERTAPTGMVDQFTAMDHHNRAALGRYAKATDSGLTETHDLSAVPDWLWLQVVETTVNFAYGRGRTCMHADTGRPAPYFASAWKPGLVTCHLCVPLLTPKPGSPEDRMCDKCGRVCDDGIHGEVLQTRIMYMFGLCDDCHAELIAVIGE